MSIRPVWSVVVVLSLVFIVSLVGCARASAESLTLQSEEMAGVLTRDADGDYTLTITGDGDAVAGISAPVSASAINEAWSEATSSAGTSEMVLGFEDQTAQAWLISLELREPTYVGATAALEFRAKVLRKEAVTGTPDAIAGKIAQSDTPDTMMSLLTALKATQGQQ